MQKMALSVLKKLCFAYLCICVIMWAGQRKLLYFPYAAINAPASYGLSDYAEVTLADSDGTHIRAWYHTARNAYPTLVFFHGNGANMASDSAFFDALAKAGFGLLAIDYRGYGASEGSPSEEGLYQDARAAMDYAVHTLGIGPGRIVLYGESLGTGVAVKMATEYPAEGLVLQSPYTSVENVAAARYFWLPVHFLIKDGFDSLSRIAEVHAPLLLLHGERDTVVPITQGKIIFAAAHEPKEAVYFSAKGHNDLDIGERVNALAAFCRKYNFIRK